MPEYELNIRDYWLIFRRRKWIAVATFLVVFLFMVVYTKSQPVLYKSATTVRILEHRTLGSLLANLMTEVTSKPIDSEVKIIKSLPVLERVARELKLISKEATDKEVAEAISYLNPKIKSELIEGTDLIRIEVVLNDPDKAAEIANATAEAYKTENLLEKNKQARTLREFLEVQLASIKERLKKSEDILQKFKEKEQVTGIAVALTTNLANFESERSKLLRTYTEKHPDIVKLDEQIIFLKQQMISISATELEFARLARDVQLNEQTYKTFQERFEEVRIAEAEKVSDVSVLDRASPPKNPFKPNFQLNLSLGVALGIVFAFSIALLAEQLDTSLATIESIENTLKVPVLSVVPFLTLEKKTKRKGVFKFLTFRPLSTQDMLEQLRSQVIINFSSKSSIFESYRMLYTNLRLDGFGGVMKNKIVQITSSSPEEGKTITSVNLAIAAAQEGAKTLLIDTDLRKSVIHKIFGFNKEPGFTDLLLGSAELKNSLRGVVDILAAKAIDSDRLIKIPGIDNLSILTSGTPTMNVTQLLNSPALIALLRNLRQDFDVIFMDSPPTLAVSDPFAIASQVDGVILVYRVGKTSRDAISRIKVQLEGVNASIKGVVLNNISPDVKIYSTYYYHYKYYDDKETSKEKIA